MDLLGEWVVVMMMEEGRGSFDGTMGRGSGMDSLSGLSRRDAQGHEKGLGA